MKVYGNFREKIEIDPQDVIEILKTIALGGWRDWVFEKDGKYYHGYKVSAGSHSIDSEEEISIEKYNYIRALECVKDYLTLKKDNS